MDVASLIQLMQNKESILSNAVGQAFAGGDLERMNALQKELLDTQNTLSQLRLLAEITHAASASNTTPAEVVASGIDAIQNTVQGPSASAVINGYDISAYATDPLYEQKIMNILASMPLFSSPEEIDAYVQNVAPGSPVTGVMTQTAASVYRIDLPLLIAIMQNDSSFGTLGVGARTNNPGNVGNTGSEERSYASWEDGVLAVAEWLSRHRYVAEEPTPIPTPVPDPVEEKPAKKKKVVEEEPEEEEEPEPEPEPEPEVPQEEATTTPPIEPEEATTTPSEVVNEEPPAAPEPETASSTEQVP